VEEARGWALSTGSANWEGASGAVARDVGGRSGDGGKRVDGRDLLPLPSMPRLQGPGLIRGSRWTAGDEIKVS